ncbi:hypothetical protein M3484_00285 [Pseudomonas sp. GX19020]|uniref:hypothetical protein n=1 Tax=Pseudomonas sp. GX19020 TaxID=2942277 RepID=UPI00201A010C|nr:hypothetical protein [Pseudomonas sp. GX19020]MCL4065015.1 hypothetical protein [Pseudomonas sp. GX19020]
MAAESGAKSITEPREKRGYRDLLALTNVATTTMAADAATTLLAGRDAVFVDIRDLRQPEREALISGARPALRGMRAAWIDAASPWHKPWLAEDWLYVVCCASGWRSAQVAEVAGQMGLTARASWRPNRLASRSPTAASGD